MKYWNFKNIETEEKPIKCLIMYNNVCRPFVATCHKSRVM